MPSCSLEESTPLIHEFNFKSVDLVVAFKCVDQVLKSGLLEKKVMSTTFLLEILLTIYVQGGCKVCFFCKKNPQVWSLN